MLFYQTASFYSNGNLLLLRFKPKKQFELFNDMIISAQLLAVIYGRYMSINSLLKEIEVYIYI